MPPSKPPLKPISPQRRRVQAGDILRAEQEEKRRAAKAREAKAQEPAPPPEAPPADPARQAAFNLGLSAESRAASFLLSRGYRILNRRYRSPAGEIDIIAQRGNLVVFVEVKARPTTAEAAFAVTPRQRRRIAASAEAWLALSPAFAQMDCRFDAVLVAPNAVPVHIPGAFEIEDGWDD